MATEHSPLAQFLIQRIVPLHIAGVDISYTNSALMMTIVVVLITGLLLIAARRPGLVPGLSAGGMRPPAIAAAVGKSQAAIAAEPWGPRLDVAVRVKDGSVDLGGTYTNETERAALEVLVENTPGVKEVRDRPARVEPVFGTVLPPEGPSPTIA